MTGPESILNSHLRLSTSVSDVNPYDCHMEFFWKVQTEP